MLDERLRRGYEDFDGFILSERERAQAQSNAAGSSQIGGGANNEVASNAGDGVGAASQQQTLPAPGSTSGVPSASQSASSSRAVETFSPPEDIPSGRDDDVVARQLREAAMNEADPELREALWDEYRNYTGIGGER